MTSHSSLEEARELAGDNLLTLQTHILQEQSQHPGATGTFSWILSAIALAAKVIAGKNRRARIDDVLGALDCENVQGERQQKLDVIANHIILRCLGTRTGVAVVASEEDENPTLIRSEVGDEQCYCVLFDPLDGSSNIDICGGVGTIFSILRYDPCAETPEEAVLQRGTRQRAAGYILYGPSTVFVVTTGDGVHMFVLDPTIGAFVRVESHLKIPENGKIYSCNEAYRPLWPAGYRAYLDDCQANGWTARYAGAMVADVHRTLLKGGTFLYPPTEKAPQGKLRLLYEANPMAMLIEQAGGAATDGQGRIMEIEPTTLHQRTPVILGCRAGVERVQSFLG